MTRVLVTGGAGFIGSHLVDELLRTGYAVTVLDSLEPEVHAHGRPDWLPAAARFIHGDVRDAGALDQALEGCHGVFHLAAWGGFAPEPARMADVNCTGTARLFEAVARSGRVRKVVTASSMAVYGEGWYRCAAHGRFHGVARDPARLARGEWSMPCPACGEPAEASAIADDAAPTSLTPYACSKLYQERLTLGCCRELGIAGVALRYFLTFGPRQSVHNPYSGICSIFSVRLINGHRPVVYEDGRQTRDMVYVDDTVQATRLAFENPAADGRVLNVARGESVAVGDLARRLAVAYGCSIEPEIGRRYRPTDSRHMLGDAAALRALGWKPGVDLDEGLRRYAAWFRELAGPRDGFAEAERRLRAAGVVREASGDAT